MAVSVVMMSTLSLDLDLEPWRAVNDGVMGGISSGTMLQDGEHLVFAGVLSLENNGGFSSVRRLVRTDLATATGIRLTFRGDGRRYQFRLRQNERFDGVSWRAEFSTAGDWQTLELDFADFEPVFRGNIVPGAGPVAPAAIRQIGFLIADKQPGPFRLEIRAIEFLLAETE
jgi:monofunctional biosynthetic peptidoglycan transglycosylase